MAENRQQDLLDALKLELKFLERGGYQPSVREPRKELSIFLDSPSCLNYALPAKEHPCSECWLIDFVPVEKRGVAIPCHHIPLNHRGDTVEALGGLRRPGGRDSHARLASQDDSAAGRGAPITAASVRLTAAQTAPQRIAWYALQRVTMSVHR